MFKVIKAGTVGDFEDKLNELDAKFEVEVVKIEVISKDYALINAWIAVVRCAEKQVRVENLDEGFGYL